MYAGFAERLKSEISILAPPGAEFKVIAPNNRKFAAWKGASIFGSMSTFTD